MCNVHVCAYHFVFKNKPKTNWRDSEQRINESYLGQLLMYIHTVWVGQAHLSPRVYHIL